MDNFIGEILNICKLPFDEIVKDYKVIQLGRKAIYVCNFLKILDYSEEKILLKVAKGKLQILGEDLFISQINKKEIVVKGSIESFGMVVDEKNKK